MSQEVDERELSEACAATSEVATFLRELDDWRYARDARHGARASLGEPEKSFDRCSGLLKDETA
jgi:hypothetical protein